MFSKEFCNYIKGISILLVIMIHVVIYRYSDDIFMRIMHMLFYQGDLGVNAFFFLSAYGLCYSYEKNSLKVFYEKRLFRIFPVYLISLLVLFWLLPYIDNSEILRLILLHITGLIVIGGNEIVEWFIPALLLLYIIFPILYCLLSWVSRRKCSMWIYTMILAGCIPLFYMGLVHVHPFFLGRFSAIFMGIICYIQWKIVKEKVLLVFIIYASLSLVSFQDCKFFFLVPLIIYSMSFLKYETLLLRDCFTYLGKYSLEIYLGQNIGLFWYYSNAGGNVWIDLLVGLMISAISAVLFYNIQKYFWMLVKLIPVNKR